MAPRRKMREPEPQPATSGTVDYILKQLADLQERVSRLEREVAVRGGRFDRDDGDDSAEDLERAGNLICLTGVKLADVRPGMGDDPGPAAV